MARCRTSPKSDIFRVFVVMVITVAALPPAGSETASTISSVQDAATSSSHTTQPGVPSNSINNPAASTTPTSVRPTLSVVPVCLTLFVGMPAKTELDVTIITSHISLLNISVANGSDVFVLDGGKLVLSQTLAHEAWYRINITAQEDAVELLVRVEYLQMGQPTYLTTVPENMGSQQCILDINSNAERHGVAVVYSITSGDSMFSINSSTGVVCVEAALDGEVLSEHLLNVSLHLDLGHGPALGNDTNQAGASASYLVRVEAQKDKVPSFDNIGSELILSVPEQVNDSYVIATFKTHDSSQGFKALIQYSLTTGSSEIFSVTDGQLRVKAPDRLKDQHVFKVTVAAAYVNRTSNAAYLEVKIFVVKGEHDFTLPIILPAPILRQHCQFFLQELSNILGLRLTLVNVLEHEQTDPRDSDRSELVFKAIEINTNDTIHVNASDIGIKIAEKSGKISSLFGYFARFFNSTSDDALNSAVHSDNSSEYTLNNLSKILIAVICLLLLVVLLTIITARRLWRRCCRQKDDLSDEELLTKDNWYFSGNTDRRSTNLSEILDNIDKSDNKPTNQSEFTSTSELNFPSTSPLNFPSTSQLQDPMMAETRQKTFFFDVETRSLGLNTVARREHVRDQQMETLQQLFQALGDDILYSKNNVYPNLEKEKYEEDSLSNGGDKQDTYLIQLDTGASASATQSAAEIGSSDPDISKLKTADSATSRSTLYRSILSDEDGKGDIVTRQQHEGLQQANTLELDTDRAVVFPQLSEVLPLISDTANDVLPEISNSDPPFEESNKPHILSDIRDSREGEHKLTSIHTSDQNYDLQLENPVKSDHNEPSLALLSTNVPNGQTEGETNSQWLFPSDIQNLDSPGKEVRNRNSLSEDVHDWNSSSQDNLDGNSSSEVVQDQDLQGKNVLDLDVLGVVSAEDIVTHF